MIALMVGLVFLGIGVYGLVTGRLPRAHPTEKTGPTFWRAEAPRAFVWICSLWIACGLLIAVSGYEGWFHLL